MMPIKKAPRSLRTILIVWFLLFSVVPLAFVTGYSVVKFERAVDYEISERLIGNADEVAMIISDFLVNLRVRRDRYTREASLLSAARDSSPSRLRPLLATWMKSEIATSLTVFNAGGRMVHSSFKDEKGEIREFTPTSSAITLSNENLHQLKNNSEFSFVEQSAAGRVSLILFSRLGSDGKVLGFIEQVIDIDKNFLDKLKSRMKLEFIVMNSKGVVTIATHPDFSLYKPDFFSKIISEDKPFDLQIRAVPYRFIVYPAKWGSSIFYLGLGVSKLESKDILRNINYAFYMVVAVVLFLVVLTVFMASANILKPLDDLVKATQNIPGSELAVEIPIKSDTEIGLLTASFNEMSRSIIQARQELKKRIQDLERANQEIKDTQSRLVHSAKMVSLGQLVAGVAHELNNPIGYIYSNMGHLRDYSEKLIQLADIGEKDPSLLVKKMKEFDLDFIRKDLPNLIQSCEEGAKRTRDIVVGLRNFSRLEEAILKEFDIHESLNTTLQLLSGELKNRVVVHKQYGDVPAIVCYASQINQVFMNILSNAVQAIEDKGEIWISTKMIQRDDQPRISIAIQDSGKGMLPNVLEKIFDPFFSTKGIGQGTGLGLSISYGIIEKHGGEILVKSQAGVGTEFTVILPLRAVGTESFES